ncbi:MAG: hypothetical protein ACRCZB_05230 [Bacteroidales bacterium]
MIIKLSTNVESTNENAVEVINLFFKIFEAVVCSLDNGKNYLDGLLYTSIKPEVESEFIVHVKRCFESFAKREYDNLFSKLVPILTKEEEDNLFEKLDFEIVSSIDENKTKKVWFWTQN